MIYVNIQGRLGNQMFQYAFAKHLQKKYYPNEKIYFSFKKLEKSNKQDEGFENQLKYFKTKDLNITDKIKMNPVQFIVLYFYLILRKVICTLFNYDFMQRYNFELKFLGFVSFFGIYCIGPGYYDFKKSKFKNKIIIGCFESAKYFDDVKEDLEREFVPIKNKLNTNKKLYEEIKKSNSVCVTIRRGDFLSSQNKNTFYVCNEKYFEKAIKKMKKEVSDAKFFIFSDDVEWCKENIKTPKGTMYESGNDPVWEKLRLMYSCKNFIISNSTFSWWAQYLSRNKNKVVIAPKKWKNIDMPNDIYQDNWILM